LISSDRPVRGFKVDDEDDADDEDDGNMMKKMM
jgi:hypothetical protein